MSFGVGFGQPFGAEPLVSVGPIVSEVAGDPVTYDFTDEPDGPLPGTWEPYQYSQAAGVITGSSEPNPNMYYRVLDGLGLWAYSRSPVVGDPYVERGVAASPAGILVGRDSRLAAIFRSPLDLLDGAQDALVFEVIVGARVVGAGATFVGGRARAEWAAGVWTTPLAVEAVSASEAPPAVIATAVPPDLPDLTDIWAASPFHELIVELRGEQLDVSLDGVVRVSVVVPQDGPAKPVLIARTYQRLGTLITPIPIFQGFQLQSLRDIERLGGGPQLLGDAHYDGPTLPTSGVVLLTYELLFDKAFWKRIGGRSFQVVQDHEAEVQGTRSVWLTGDVARAVSKVTQQTFIPVVPDLAHARSRRELGS